MKTINISSSLPALAQYFNLPSSSATSLEQYYKDLRDDSRFLSEINQNVCGVESFGTKSFTDVSELRLYRSLLYLTTRIIKPSVFVETGVLNGFGSAFILLALEHNNHGRLISVDLPSDDEEIIRQGTGRLPVNKKTGWVIPEFLRGRHELLLGAAETLLPEVLNKEAPVDMFLHDSDHSYVHMMFEMCLALRFLRPGGLLISDNVEQNFAFYDLARAVQARTLLLNSFCQPDRTWQHGLMIRPQNCCDPICGRPENSGELRVNK
jgi:predicted O-methyltransferase YrrM